MPEEKTGNLKRDDTGEIAFPYSFEGLTQDFQQVQDSAGFPPARE
jgi:hypothetical protein